MEGGKGPKNQRRGGEGRGVEVDAKDLVNPREASRGARHGVMGRSQSVLVLIPRWRTWKEYLDGDANQIHVPETACKRRGTGGRSEDEDERGADDGRSKVDNAIWQPRHEVEEGVLVCRKDVAEVRAVEDVLEGRKYLDPYRWSPFAGNEPGAESQLCFHNVDRGRRRTDTRRRRPAMQRSGERVGRIGRLWGG